MTRGVLALALAPILGLVALIAPVLIWPPARFYDAPLFPLLRSAVEAFGAGQLVLLFVAGVLLGLLSRSPGPRACAGRAWLLGAAAVALLPLAALAELVQDPSSHNMLPFELAFYGFYGVLVALGALAALKLGRGAHAGGPDAAGGG